MALKIDDADIIRRYLLSRLTEEEQSAIEQRLLTEDNFFKELEITKDEVVEEYLAKQLDENEREWFEQNFLASPEGKQSHGFARALSRFVLEHPLPSQKKLSLRKRLIAFWNSQPSLLRPAAAISVIVIVAGIFWLSRPTSPQSFATLTLASSPSTRSEGTEAPRVKLKEDELRITLMLPEPTAAGTRYQVELMTNEGEIKTLEVSGQDARTVSVVTPASHLTRGQYALRLSTIDTDGTIHRVPDSYYFTIE